MVELKTLTVKLRDEHGKRRTRRLRQTGVVPAVLYGHKKDNVSLSISKEEFDAVLRHGSRFVLLTGAVNERAFIKECQWDTWGQIVLHVDFTRVSEHEKVKLSVPVELRGEAPGVKDGGVIKQHIHTIEIECEPAMAPEKIGVNINHLEFLKSVLVSEVAFPEGVKPLVDENLIVVECVEPVVEEEASEEATDGAEPEVIGRKKDEEGEEE